MKYYTNTRLAYLTCK